MGQPSSKDEMTVRHQFDRLCQMALKGEAVNYYKHMDYRRKHEVTFSELSEKELSKLFTMDEYGTENQNLERRCAINGFWKYKIYTGRGT